MVARTNQRHTFTHHFFDYLALEIIYYPYSSDRFAKVRICRELWTLFAAL